MFYPYPGGLQAEDYEQNGRAGHEGRAKGGSNIEGMPKPIRWTFYAEKLGLLFMPQNGTIGHHNDHGSMLNGSHFIGVDGMEYDARAEIKSVSWNEWNICCNAIVRVGLEVLFSKLSSEVTAFVQENAKYHLEKMEEELPEMRDMYLAYLAKLCYLPDGKSPYDTLVTATSPNKQKFQVYEIGKKRL